MTLLYCGAGDRVINAKEDLLNSLRAVFQLNFP